MHFCNRGFGWRRWFHFNLAAALALALHRSGPIPPAALTLPSRRCRPGTFLDSQPIRASTRHGQARSANHVHRSQLGAVCVLALSCLLFAHDPCADASPARRPPRFRRCVCLAGRNAMHAGPVLSRHPGEVFLATGRRGLELSSSERSGDPDATPDEIERTIAAYKVAYLMVADDRYASTVVDPLKRFITERQERVRKVWSSDQVHQGAAIYEIVSEKRRGGGLHRPSATRLAQFGFSPWPSSGLSICGSMAGSASRTDSNGSGSRASILRSPGSKRVFRKRWVPGLLTSSPCCCRS